MNEMRSAQDAPAKSAWMTPCLLYDGELRDLVLGGMGKLSIAGADPGDAKKPSAGGAG